MKIKRWMDLRLGERDAVRECLRHLTFQATGEDLLVDNDDMLKYLEIVMQHMVEEDDEFSLGEP